VLCRIQLSLTSITAERDSFLSLEMIIWSLVCIVNLTLLSRLLTYLLLWWECLRWRSFAGRMLHRYHMIWSSIINWSCTTCDVRSANWTWNRIHRSELTSSVDNCKRLYLWRVLLCYYFCYVICFWTSFYLPFADWLRSVQRWTVNYRGKPCMTQNTIWANIRKYFRN